MTSGVRHGAPAIAATPHPGVFKGKSVVRATNKPVKLPAGATPATPGKKEHKPGATPATPPTLGSAS